MKKTNSEKTYATLKPGKTYKFAGYSWTACEVNNDRHVAVIQSHGLTTPTGKPVGFLLPSLACNRAPYEYFHRLWNTGISLFE